MTLATLAFQLRSYHRPTLQEVHTLFTEARALALRSPDLSEPGRIGVDECLHEALNTVGQDMVTAAEVASVDALADHAVATVISVFETKAAMARMRSLGA